MMAKKFVYIGLSIFILLTIGIGTAQAAQKTLPGDTLYGFKVNVVEEVKSAFFVNPQKKAKYESERVQTRFEEVKTLVESNKELDNKIIDEANNNIEKHTNKVVNVVNNLDNNKENPNSLKEVVDNLKNSLDSYRALIEVIYEKEDDYGGVDSEVSELLNNIESIKESAQNIQRKIESDMVLKNNTMNDESVSDIDSNENKEINGDEKTEVKISQVGGEAHISAGSKHVKLTELVIETNKEVGMREFKVTCTMPEGQKTIDNMYAEAEYNKLDETQSVYTSSGYQAASFSGRFGMDRVMISDREVINIYGDISKDLNKQSFECGIQSSNQIGVYDYNENKTLFGNDFQSIDTGFFVTIYVSGDISTNSNYQSYLTNDYIKILEKVGIDPASMPKNMTYPLRECLVEQLGPDRYDTLWYQRDKVNINDALKSLPCAKFL